MNSFSNSRQTQNVFGNILIQALGFDLTYRQKVPNANASLRHADGYNSVIYVKAGPEDEAAA